MITFRFGERHRLRSRLGVGSELRPSTAQRSPVQFHPRRAADERRPIFLIETLNVMQANAGRELAWQRLGQSADFERGHHSRLWPIRFTSFIHFGEITRETGLAANVAVLNFQDAHVKFGISIACENERADEK